MFPVHPNPTRTLGLPTTVPAASRTASTVSAPFAEWLSLESVKTTGQQGTYNQILAKFMEISNEHQQIEFLEDIATKLDWLSLQLDPRDNDINQILTTLKNNLVNQLDTTVVGYNSDPFTTSTSAPKAISPIGRDRLQKLIDTDTTQETVKAPERTTRKIYDADGNCFVTKGEISDGNCGLLACFLTTKDKISEFSAKKAREELNNCIRAEVNWRNNPTTHADQEKNLQTIFGNFNHCKKYVERSIKTMMHNRDLAERTKWEMVLSRLAPMTNFNAILADGEISEHLRKIIGFEHSHTAFMPKDWLAEGDVHTLMLSKGYIVTNRSLPVNDKATPSHAQTVTQFTHLIDGNVVYIANNANPRQFNKVGNEGTHWVCVNKK